MAEVYEINVNILEDEMEAYIYIDKKEPSAIVSESGESEESKKMRVEKLTVPAILDKLKLGKVLFGVDQEMISRIVAEELVDEEFLIAKGIEKVDGIDGEYTYHFNTDVDKKPKIREDGSVDYWSIHVIETVEEGNLIAEYKEPIDGTNGMTVTGKPLIAKRGRPLPPLLGKGFERSKDGKEYRATICGKLDYNGSRIQISPVYEVNGDVGVNTGNIDFRGDVIIHGNVTSGASIKCTGTCTVDGVSEACSIDAGKDVMLRGGFLGGKRGSIVTNGNVFAKFIEYAYVRAEGFVEAESELDSVIISHDYVKFAGKKGAAIGGAVSAVRGVEVGNLGNANEILTIIKVGALREILAESEQLKRRIAEDTDVVNKIVQGLNQFDETAKIRGIDVSKDERRVALLRARIAKQADINEHKERMDYLNKLVLKSKGARVVVRNCVHPRVDVSIDALSVRTKDAYKSVEFVQKPDKILMYSLSGALID